MKTVGVWPYGFIISGVSKFCCYGGDRAQQEARTGGLLNLLLLDGLTLVSVLKLSNLTMLTLRRKKLLLLYLT